MAFGSMVAHLKRIGGTGVRNQAGVVGNLVLTRHGHQLGSDITVLMAALPKACNKAECAERD